MELTSYQKEQLTQYISPLNMNKEQQEVLAELTREAAKKEYVPLEPQKTERPPLFARKLNTADEVLERLHHIKGDSPAAISRKGHQIFAQMSAELRSNPQEMLKIIREHPKTFSLANPEIVTKDFALQVLQVTHRAYDLLPEELQQDPQIIQAHVKGALQKPHYLEIDNGLRSGDFRHVMIPSLSPRCPMDKVATEELYKDLCKKALLGENTKRLEKRANHDWEIEIGTTTAMIAVVKEESPGKDYLEIEKEAFKETKAQMLEQVKPDVKANDARHMDNIADFAKKHNMPEFMDEYRNTAWDRHCRQLAERDSTIARGLSDSTLAILKQNAPQSIAEKYFDLETGKPRKTAQMPSHLAFDNNPAAKDAKIFDREPTNSDHTWERE